MAEWLNNLLWGNPQGLSGAPTLYEQRRQLGQRMGLPSQGTMGIGRQREREVPEMDLSWIRRAMQADEAQRNAPSPTDPLGMPQGGANVTSPYQNPIVGAPAPGVPLPPQRPAGLGGSSGSMADARQQEINYANKPNPLVPQGGSGGAVGARNSGQMFGPTMADMPNGGKPTYYTMDPGDGGILRTVMSKNGMPPQMSGFTVAGQQAVPEDQGLLAKFLRGAF